jgi:hypothetical protein
MQDGRSFWGMAAVAAAIVAAALVGADAVRDVKRAGDQIAVTGSARMRVTSDFAVWRCTVNGSGATAAEATAALRSDRDRLGSFLADRGVPAEAVTMQPLGVYGISQYDAQGRDTGRVLRWDANQTLEVRSADIGLVAGLADGVERLMLDGVRLNPMAPEYIYTRLDEARVALMGDATRDALSRAEQIASAAGGRVGPIRDARMGVIQVVAPSSTSVSDYGMYDTSTREKDVVAVVKVSFAVR